MSITFIVGSAVEALGPEFARAVEAELRKRYAEDPAAHGDEAYRSDEVDARGWRELQQRAGALAPQVAKMDAYQAVYVPGGPSPIEQLPIPNAADPFQVGSIDALVSELRTLAEAHSLPVDDIELMQLSARYLEDDALFDRDLDVQMYVQLMLSAKQAASRRQPLWVVA